ncbi:hypothetical protein HK27_05725 [Acetobacter orientalis]|uniref:Uncharacterized protein n=1 Tax=Acetobacter orientalis TaxID=146474 RepID=A0A252CA93_9PROT|nr:hypothetical protein [Acetobacter orientalis]OUI85436.1 hypothetical protein HK12_00115 [Acetobacter orientalis]OUJ17922.1 hypothetical protein HK27_05725 [Acetobacter orientalis]
MNWHLIDWVWHVRGNLSLPVQQTSSETLGKIEPLFQEVGTTHERTNDGLIFSKKNQPSQDKMAVFDNGILSIEKSQDGSFLRYDLTSKTLLFCFLTPLFFLIMAELTIVVKHLQKPSTEVSQSVSDKAKEEKYLIQSPIDKALGVPAPEKKSEKDKEGQGKRKLSPTAAYVFAGIFSILYVIGRIREALSVKSLFRKYIS